MKKTDRMGKIVTVSAVMRSGYKHTESPTKRIWRRMEITPRAGWIVGFRTVFEGTIEEDCNFEDCCGTYFNHQTPIKTVLVSFWPTMNPEHVLEEDIKEGGKPHSPGWSDKDRAEYKKWFEKTGIPRDALGRFV